MSRLLRAGFVRLFKDKIFWICNAVMLIYSLDITLDTYFASVKFDWYSPEMDDFVFRFLAYGGILYAVFCALFIGREYSDGTMRNKLVIGHKRLDIFLSTLIVSSVGCVIMTLFYILPAALIGIPTIGWFKKPFQLIFITFIALLILAVAYAAMFTVLALMNSNKSVNAVISIVLVIGLLMAGATMYNALNEPEFYSPATVMEMNDDGEIAAVEAPEMPNPYYVSGFKRQVYQILADVSPGGQSAQLTSLYSENPEKLALWSVVLTAVLTAVGVLLFSRKDLK